jgi:hypothetical protein
MTRAAMEPFNWTTLLGKSRLEVVTILGEPDDKGGTSRKYPTPSIYKYGDIEVHFGPRYRDTCWLVFNNAKHETICKEINSQLPRR